MADAPETEKGAPGAPPGAVLAAAPISGKCSSDVEVVTMVGGINGFDIVEDFGAEELS